MSTPRGGLRQRQAEDTRARLVDAAISLIEEGRPCTMRSTAQAAGVGERTVYRYFESRDALANAVRARLSGRAGAPLPAATAELSDYVRRLYATFDDNARLVASLVRGAVPTDDFAHTRSQNLRDLQRIIDRDYPEAPLPDRRAAAASLRALLSGAGWVYLRLSCGLSNAEVIRAGQWSVRTALSALERAAR